ncbi:hypothetical protein COCNU_scaffold000431G000060 [Cocos nucifera]|nr:hypothetical protein [Cocos nucifera]
MLASRVTFITATKVLHSGFPSNTRFFPILKHLKLDERGIKTNCHLNAVHNSQELNGAPGEVVDDDEDDAELCPVDCVREFKTEEEFRRILDKAKESGSLVVVDFYRTSCGSCKYIEQGFAKLCKGSGDREADVVFLKHNITFPSHENIQVALIKASLCKQVKMIVLLNADIFQTSNDLLSRGNFHSAPPSPIVDGPTSYTSIFKALGGEGKERKKERKEKEKKIKKGREEEEKGKKKGREKTRKEREGSRRKEKKVREEEEKGRKERKGAVKERKEGREQEKGQKKRGREKKGRKKERKGRRKRKEIREGSSHDLQKS